MNQSIEHNEIITKDAYLLWEQAGRPVGRSEEFWLLAEANLKAASGPTDAESGVETSNIVELRPVKSAKKSKENSRTKTGLTTRSIRKSTQKGPVAQPKAVKGLKQKPSKRNAA